MDIFSSDIFWGLIVSHFLADFTFQTNYIAMWKDKSIWGRWVHVFIFLVASYIILFPSLNYLWFIFRWSSFQGWFVVFILTCLHLLEDHFRIWCVHEKKMRDNILFFMYDQLIHVGLIIIFTPRISKPCMVSIPVMQLGVLFVLTTHFTTILVYYLEKTFLPEAHMTFKEKHLSILERLIIALCFLIPGWWWSIGVGAYLTYKVHAKYKGKTNSRTWINLIVSYVVAIITGLLARLILY